MARNVPETSLRLSDLHRAHGADATLENLLSTLTGKIQACTRLTVFAYEAGSEGHPALAVAFRDLADAERQSFDALLVCLRRHLDEKPSSAGAQSPESRLGGR